MSFSLIDGGTPEAPIGGSAGNLSAGTQPATPHAPREGANANNVRPTEEGIADHLATIFEEPNRFGRQYIPGVDPEHYEKSLPSFIKAVEDVGGKPGDDIRTIASKIVGALRDRYGFTPDRLANMKPYLLQFIKDVQDGHAFTDYNNVFDVPPTPPQEDAVNQRRENEETERALPIRYTPKPIPDIRTESERRRDELDHFYVVMDAVAAVVVGLLAMLFLAYYGGRLIAPVIGLLLGALAYAVAEGQRRHR
jgi:hypothetical protein